LSAIALVILPALGTRFVVLCAVPLTYLVLYLGAVVPIAIGRRNDISYGMYMYGFPVEQLIRTLHFASQAAFVTVSLLATVPVAVASWFLIERPAMRWRNGSPRAKPDATLSPVRMQPSLERQA
jgi:peptidoglycan/LPS O-acetylase OafA/YrhL